MSTIQLLIDGERNRAAIRSLIEDRYDVDTEQSVNGADVYVVDDHSFPRHHQDLRERIEANQPEFCPVVLIRRDNGHQQISLQDPEERDGPLLVDDIVDAPVNRARLFRRLNTLLVRREQSKQLRHYVSKLEQSNERLEQFAYAASHDLQEPLRMITSYLQLIERRYGDELDEDGEEFLAFAVDGADRMREMIQGLLEYSRIDTGSSALEAIDLNDVLDDVQQDLGVKIAEHDADVTVESLPRVAGDDNQLRQLFQNLVENAIEYSGTDAPEVVVTAERANGRWKLSVSDDGVGIDEAQRDRVFEVFQRLHSRDEHAGTGIGLALCDRIVERHGGDIWVESDSGDGATFSFTLPPASAVEN